MIILVAQMVYLWRNGILTSRYARPARSTLLIAASTGVTATLIAPMDLPSAAGDVCDRRDQVSRQLPAA